MDYINNKDLLPYIIASVDDEKLILKYYFNLSYDDKLITLENIKYNNDLQIYLLNNSNFNKDEYLYALRFILKDINDLNIINDLYKKIDIEVVKKFKVISFPLRRITFI